MSITGRELSRTERIMPTCTRALLCATLLLAPNAALAKNRGAEQPAITVEATGGLAHWRSQIAHDLDDHLIYPIEIGGGVPRQGAVRIGFHCGQSGTPEGVSVIESSRSRLLDRAALQAVTHIPTLHPLPEGIGHDRPMEAWIFFAFDQEQIDKMKRRLEQQRQVREANASPLHAGTQVASNAPLIIASR
jgi:TonB family protein